MVAGLNHVIFSTEIFPSKDLEKVEKVQKVLSVIWPFLPLLCVAYQAGFVVV
jgi:hypothetical protein